MANNKLSLLASRVRRQICDCQITFHDVVDSITHEPFKYPGEVLSGHLKVVGETIADIKVDIVFEGYVRTWLLGNNADPYTTNARKVAQLKLLDQLQTISAMNACDCVDSSDATSGTGDTELAGQHTMYLRFNFTIPHHFISPRGDVAEELLNLCPSAKLGMSYRAPFEDERYGQPNITYAVRVLRVRSSTSPSLSQSYQFHDCVAREVLVRPAPRLAPPVHLDDFPNEYSVQAAVILRRRHYRRNGIGILNVTSDEPAPMEFDVRVERNGDGGIAWRPSTMAKLKLFLTPFNGVSCKPLSWTWSVKQSIRSRTFFSTSPMDRAPTSHTAKEKTSVMRFTDHFSSSTTFEYRLDAEEWIGAERKDDNGHCWSAELPIRITSAEPTLVPTFLNQLAARRYAITLSIKVRELHHRPLQLVLPLQVISGKAYGSNGVHANDATGIQGALPSVPNSFDDDIWDLTSLPGAPNLPLYILDN